MKALRALILCAGKGTRLRPITNKIPKPMVKVGDKPVLEHLVDRLNKYGITEIIANLHYKPEVIMKYFGTKLLYFYEPKLLGEQKTEKALSPWLGERYIVMNGDTLTNISFQAMLFESNFLNYSLSSYDGDVYTGTKIVMAGQEEKKVDFFCYWQDIGTPQGLKKARREWKR